MNEPSGQAGGGAGPGGAERRQEVRLRSVNLINFSSVQQPEGPDELAVYDRLGTARTLDLSASGCRLETVEPLLADLELTFDLQLAEHVVRCRGRTIRSVEAADGRWETGVAFLDLDELASDGIRLYLSFRADDEA